MGKQESADLKVGATKRQQAAALQSAEADSCLAAPGQLPSMRAGEVEPFKRRLHQIPWEVSKGNINQTSQRSFYAVHTSIAALCFRRPGTVYR